jgi:hypothetical protein
MTPDRHPDVICSVLRHFVDPHSIVRELQIGVSDVTHEPTDLAILSRGFRDRC